MAGLAELSWQARWWRPSRWRASVTSLQLLTSLSPSNSAGMPELGGRAQGARLPAAPAGRLRSARCRRPAVLGSRVCQRWHMLQVIRPRGSPEPCRPSAAYEGQVCSSGCGRSSGSPLHRTLEPPMCASTYWRIKTDDQAGSAGALSSHNSQKDLLSLAICRRQFGSSPCRGTDAAVVGECPGNGEDAESDLRALSPGIGSSRSLKHVWAGPGPQGGPSRV